MTQDMPAARAGDEDTAQQRHARFSRLPPRSRPEDWIEEAETDPPDHDLQQSINIVQHPGRTYET